MEPEKRKRKADGESNGEGSVKSREEDRGGFNESAAVPGDEEVDEFFAILKRARMAVEYFRRGNRRADGHSAAMPWCPAFEREDLEGAVEKGGGRLFERPDSGLDLNSDPNPVDVSVETDQN